MPFFSATRSWTVREVVVVECGSPSEARELIDEEDDEVIPIAEVDGDPEIVPGTLQIASPEEVAIYKRRKR
jgi:hypothetical protein